MPKESDELSNLRARLRLLKQQCRNIGQPPPRPPTLRGYFGALLVSVVQRMLFWYTPVLRRALEEAVEALDGALQATERSAGLLAQQQVDHRLQVQMRLAELENRLREQTGGRLAELENRLREQAETHIEQERLRLNALLDEAREDRFAKEEDLAKRLKEAEEHLQLLRREIVQQSRRVSYFLEESRKSMPAPLDEQLRAFEQEDLHELDPLYVSFEDTLRGPREEIREQCKVYLPFLENAKASSVLDIGCGRGEWLELLHQHGIPARGIDLNRFMVEECRARQLDAQQADALDYLGGIPDSSVGAITAFHIVEHLPLPKLIRLLDEMIRVLQPGGVAILETPNPDNILVGARNFYFDPSHRNPIPSETLRFLVEARGLCQLEVLPLHPCDPCNEVPDREGSLLTQRFNQYFYGPQDYAIIGRKP